MLCLMLPRKRVGRKWNKLSSTKKELFQARGLLVGGYTLSGGSFCESVVPSVALRLTVSIVQSCHS